MIVDGMVKIGTVISYCTNDYRFLSTCIKELRAISSEIVVSVCDHFFDGTAEERELLHKSYSENRDVRFVEFAYGEPYGLYGSYCVGEEIWTRHWHNTSRYVGLFQLSDDIDYVLFVDVDEIAEGQRLAEWLEDADLVDLMLFSSFVYLGDESRRSPQSEHAHLLIKRELIKPQMLFNSHERAGFFLDFDGEKQAFIKGKDGLPMVHHYNWVRSKQELRKKVAAWGHKKERDWHKLLDEGRLEDGTGHEYHRVKPKHDILSIDVEAMKQSSFYSRIPVEEFSHVNCINRDDVMRIMIERELLS